MFEDMRDMMRFKVAIKMRSDKADNIGKFFFEPGQ